MQSVQISGTATYPPLSAVTQPNIPTVQAAFYLCRKPQTLRIWASKESGPLRPVRIYGRLAWRVADIKALTGAV
jgi:hypothetical protein